MPARFDDSIPYFGDKVIAIGPLHKGETVKEVCAWVYQPTADLASDAAATEMTTTTKGKAGFQTDPGKRWLLRLERISAAPFRDGKAFAVAVALVEDLTAPINQRVMWWGQPVDLFKDEARVAAAEKDGALLEGKALHAPAPYPPP